jgi:importin subunit alpha-6/7
MKWKIDAATPITGKMFSPFHAGSLYLGLEQKSPLIWECRICSTVRNTPAEELGRQGVLFCPNIRGEDCLVEAPLATAQSKMLEAHYQSENHRRCVQAFLVIGHNDELRGITSRWLGPFVEQMPANKASKEVRRKLYLYNRCGNTARTTEYFAKALLLLHKERKLAIQRSMYEPLELLFVRASLIDSTPGPRPWQSTSSEGDSLDMVIFLVLPFLPEFAGKEFVVPSARAVHEQELPAVARVVMGLETDIQMHCTTQLENLLCRSKYQPTQQIIDTGALPSIVRFLTRHDNPSLQVTAAGILICILFHDVHDHLVVEAGAIPALVPLLTSDNANVREEAIAALGSIACYPPSRALILQAGALPPLLQEVRAISNPRTLGSGSIALAQLGYWSQEPSIEQLPAVESITSKLSQLLLSTENAVWMCACTALEGFGFGASEETIQAVVESRVCRRLMDYLEDPNQTAAWAACVLGNIHTNNDLHNQLVADNIEVSRFLGLLSSPSATFRKHACFALSKIVTGNKRLIQAVVDKYILRSLIDLLADSELAVRKQAVSAVASLMVGANATQVQALVRRGCVRPWCNLLTMNDSETVGIVLKGLENILSKGEATRQEGLNEIVKHVREAGGIDLIRGLQERPDSDIQSQATHLLITYFDGSREQEVKQDRVDLA